MAPRVTVAAQVANELGEAPVWCEVGQRLHWVDIRAPAVWRLDPSGRLQHWPMPDLCGALVPARHGRLAVGLLSQVDLFDPATGERERLAEIEPPSFGNRLNEAKCDGAGRLWVGSMRDFAAATTGALYRVDLGTRPATVTRVLPGITVPNALAWSPDGGTMYFADTADGRLRAYPFDAEAGTLGAMRVLVEYGRLPGKPDGVALDADGCLWNARYGGGSIARITPDGRIDRVIDLPVSQPTSCVFGGPGLRTLFVTTARQRLSPACLAAEPLAGAVLAVDTGQCGLPIPSMNVR